jgi:hypothetical protein
MAEAAEVGKAEYQPNPQLIESMLMFAATEQTPGILADEMKDAHYRRHHASDVSDRVNAGIEW